jgi:hypothetical protein
MDKELEALTKALADAEKKQLEHLRKIYQKGAKIAVFLRHGQKIPSWGTVVGHWSGTYGGEVMVDLDNAKEWSRTNPKRIPVSQIYACQPAFLEETK